MQGRSGLRGAGTSSSGPDPRTPQQVGQQNSTTLNENYNTPEIHLYDQLQPQPQHEYRRLSTPVQAGQYGNFGQAKLEFHHEPLDTDGSSSMNYINREPTSQPYQDVPPQQQMAINGASQHSYTGSMGGRADTSTEDTQSASGFWQSAMNQASGRQLKLFPSVGNNIDAHQQQERPTVEGDRVLKQLQQMGYSDVQIQLIQQRYGLVCMESVQSFVHYEDLYRTHTSSTGAPTSNPTLSYHTAHTGISQMPSTAQSDAINVAHRPSSLPTAATLSNPKYPGYNDPQARLRSFENWPGSSVQTPSALTDTGLFYTGKGDTCRCYVCGGDLQRWEPNDNPWFEHARVYPLCEYVQRMRGQAFIDSAKRTCQGREPSTSGSVENSQGTHMKARIEEFHSARRESLLDPSYCGACKQRRVRVSQRDCGCVVCMDCAPDMGLESPRCKICKQVVVKCNAIDPTVYEKRQ